ncbi:hypothetical protein GQ43DRAFT_437638 [Delitschia confertaspora ATCC 74209]|uniref:Ilp is an apoptosis inhibitor n=1 Tax=Delitschia confertaspora ATCC 74209 TaxID=1513339 RepID=A0A9P4MW47_9PLEO|nr:hypothetical protein GQ43DRAFT_437638 [Delitschia confertaspora ATCC 74209]
MSFFAGFPNTGNPSYNASSRASTGARASSEDTEIILPRPDESSFDTLEWHPYYQSCQRYFLDYGQHNPATQAVTAIMNIRLPFQWDVNPLMSSVAQVPPSSGPSAYNHPGPWHRSGPVQGQQTLAWVSLIPYIRRLIVSGFDTEGMMSGFFGEDWRPGVGPLHECERRNYLFAAKSVGWAKVKSMYDISPHESVLFLKPLQRVQLVEIEAAERTWSRWLAMEDWMVGPRAPEVEDEQAHERARHRETGQRPRV